MSRNDERAAVLVADLNSERRVAVCALLPAYVRKIACDTVAEVLEKARLYSPSVVVLGMLPDQPAVNIALVARLHSLCQDLKVILIADAGSETLIIHAFRAGAVEYVRPPVVIREVSETILRLLPDRRPVDPCEDIIGDSPQMRSIKSLISRIAPTDATVLITGETGTGKELVATTIHRLSRRSAGPLISLNCAAIPETLLESELFGFEKGAFTGALFRQEGKIAQAHRGTSFLDEIGDLSLTAQAKILRAVETREVRLLGSRTAKFVDVRFIAATNQELERLAAEGKFRQDLFFRLNVINLRLPSLRERPEDIPRIAQRLIRDLSLRQRRPAAGLTPDAMSYLSAQPWPGNVRQLRNVLESALVFSGSEWITERHVSSVLRMVASPPSLRQFHTSRAVPIVTKVSDVEQLRSALEVTAWNKTQAAELLRWSRMTVYRRIRAYNLRAPSEETDGEHSSNS